MASLTLVPALIGGALIGVSASMMLLLNGRIAGISGIAGGLLQRAPDRSPRLAFIGGLLAGGLVLAAVSPHVFTMSITRSPAALIVAGLLVGVGTRIGNGCTSGHGVCGISRLSPRSMAATATFMFTGMVAAAIVTQLFGGAI